MGVGRGVIASVGGYRTPEVGEGFSTGTTERVNVRMPLVARSWALTPCDWPLPRSQTCTRPTAARQARSVGGGGGGRHILVPHSGQSSHRETDAPETLCGAVLRHSTSAFVSLSLYAKCTLIIPWRSFAVSIFGSAVMKPKSVHAF